MQRLRTLGPGLTVLSLAGYAAGRWVAVPTVVPGMRLVTAIDLVPFRRRESL